MDDDLRSQLKQASREVRQAREAYARVVEASRMATRLDDIDAGPSWEDIADAQMDVELAEILYEALRAEAA